MFDLETAGSYHGVLRVGLDAEFITTMGAISKGFPWKRFEAFFSARPIGRLTAEQQIFMLRIIAIQEYLCVDDEAALIWIERQSSVAAFLSSGEAPGLPALDEYQGFCSRLQELNILFRFRERCQRLIMKYAENSGEPETITNPVLSLNSNPATWSESLLGSNWVSCPECHSYSPEQSKRMLDNTDSANRCSLCGHNFRAEQ